MAKIAVALSGGVDSSVAALLLREAGHQLLGLSLRLGRGPDRAWRLGAEAARSLNISHQVVDVTSEFGSRVLDRVVRDYSGGLTPNPCALCNARVKFPLLWQAARENGCELLATGHYARLTEIRGIRFLAEGADPSKSQAYFLARLDQSLLEKLVFPLGGMFKSQVKDLAREAGLRAADRGESQDACFLPQGGWDELMSQHNAVRTGVVEDDQGRLLGNHRGLHRYTVGQRRGLGLAMGYPVYVTALDGPRAAVRVGPKPDLATRGLTAREPVWYRRPGQGAEVTVRFRYSHRGVGCSVSGGEETLEVGFSQEQGAVAPGQLAVFYQEQTIIGSAWIFKSIPSKGQEHHETFH